MSKLPYIKKRNCFKTVWNCSIEFFKNRYFFKNRGFCLPPGISPSLLLIMHFYKTSKAFLHKKINIQYLLDKIDECFVDIWVTGVHSWKGPLTRIIYKNNALIFDVFVLHFRCFIDKNVTNPNWYYSYSYNIIYINKKNLLLFGPTVSVKICNKWENVRNERNKNVYLEKSQILKCLRLNIFWMVIMHNNNMSNH